MKIDQANNICIGTYNATSVYIGGNKVWSALDPDTQKIIDAMTNKPNASRQTLINNVVVYLKSTNSWEPITNLYITSSHHTQASRLNWRNPALNILVPINSPTFVVDRGWNGDGITSVLDSGFVPSGAMARDNCHQGVWCLSNTQSTSFDIGNAVCGIISRDASGKLRTRARSGSTSSDIVPTSVGHSLWSRTGVNSYVTAKNGIVLGSTKTDASTATVGSSLWVCGKNDSTLGYSNRQIAAAHWGASLSLTQIGNIYQAINTYLLAIGAI